MWGSFDPPWCMWALFSCGMQTLSCSIWDLVPGPGIEPEPPALAAQCLSHWTTREAPRIFWMEGKQLILLLLPLPSSLPHQTSTQTSVQIVRVPLDDLPELNTPMEPALRSRNRTFSATQKHLLYSFHCPTPMQVLS